MSAPLKRPGLPYEQPALAKTAAGAGAHPAGQWYIPAGDYASTRFSDLADINTQNVGQLKPAFTFDTGYLKGHEAAPLVVGSTMYLVTPYPNVVYALDLTKPDRPVKWSFNPHPNPKSQGVACCDVVDRGMSYDNGRLFMVTLDGQVIALDANTGAQVWRTPVGGHLQGRDRDDGAAGRGRQSAGRRFRRRVRRARLAGGARRRHRQGRLEGLFDRTGQGRADRAELPAATIRSDHGKDLGVKSWPRRGLEDGGGNVWGWISYDPELHMIYYGTGNPGPWNAEQRPGDNKWTAGIFARDIDTGAGALVLPVHSARSLRPRRRSTSMILLDMPVNGTDAEGARPPGPNRLSCTSSIA